MPEIVEQLDRLHEHLNSGGTLSNFIYRVHRSHALTYMFGLTMDLAP